MWKGTMNWPIEADWKCEICGNKPPTLVGGIDDGRTTAYILTGLTWGLLYGRCRCDECHATYQMCDVSYQRLTIPVLSFDSYWARVARAGWERFHKPLDEWTEAIQETAKELTTGGEVCLVCGKPDRGSPCSDCEVKP